MHIFYQKAGFLYRGQKTRLSAGLVLIWTGFFEVSGGRWCRHGRRRQINSLSASSAFDVAELLYLSG